MARTPGRFPAGSRLRKPAEFKQVFASRTRSADSQFVVLARRNGGSAARLGLVVSRRNQPSAVDRNRIKRIIRESFRVNRYKLAGLDVVVLAQKTASRDDKEKLRRSLAQHWERIAKCEES